MKHAQYSLCICIVGALIIMAVRAEATPYSFSLDRFEVVGNLPGSVVDEFDNGSLDPLWVVEDPTGIESGGVLTLSSSGGPKTGYFDGLYLTGQGTEIWSNPSGALTVQDGAGDYQATTTWARVVPDSNQWFSVSTGLVTSLDEIGVQMAVGNLSPATADFLGVPPGLGISFGGGGVVFAGGAVVHPGGADFQTVAVMPDDIVGDILLRITFDDESNSFTGSFSLDGGATFLSPFSPVATPLPPEVRPLATNWSLSAAYLDVSKVPEPSTFLLLASGLAVLAGLAGGRQERGQIEPSFSIDD